MGMSAEEINTIINSYPSLQYKKTNCGDIFFGELFLNHIFDNVRMTDKYVIEILIPNGYPEQLPKVKEISNKIDESYPHQYSDGTLCLASNIELILYFYQTDDLDGFIEQYVIPYFYSYKYFETYGIYPYGERSHGIEGDLEYLKEVFNVDNINQVYDIMLYIIGYDYRGHIGCPCGSGKRLRNCHGNLVIKMKDAGLQNYFYNILERLVKKQKRKD